MVLHVTQKRRWTQVSPASMHGWHPPSGRGPIVIVNRWSHFGGLAGVGFVFLRNHLRNNFV